MAMLAGARIANTIVMKSRADRPGWKGGVEKEDEEADLLVLVSQDRWIRMRGLVRDVKMVTAGRWLREMKAWENFWAAAATSHPRS